jgi:hypothetical protein
MLSSLLIYISTQSFNFAITVGLLYLGVSIVRHSKLGDGLYIVDVETGVDPTAPDGVTDDGHNGYDIAPRSPSYEGSGPDPQYESETSTEETETSCEGEPGLESPDPDICQDTEETPPETEGDTALKEE